MTYREPLLACSMEQDCEGVIISFRSRTSPFISSRRTPKRYLNYRNPISSNVQGRGIVNKAASRRTETPDIEEYKGDSDPSLSGMIGPISRVSRLRSSQRIVISGWGPYLWLSPLNSPIMAATMKCEDIIPKDPKYSQNFLPSLSSKKIAGITPAICTTFMTPERVRRSS
jgi:hypothetical protein